MTNSEIYENNLQHFKIKRRYGDKAQCICPAHEDKQASLTVTQGDKCTIFRCHAGCKVDDILQAVGLNMKDTFYDVEPRSPNWKKYIESREKRKIEAVYHYVSRNGQYAFTKIRLEGKKILYGILENERFRYGLPRNTPRKSLKAIYGSVYTMNQAISEGKPIFIPEGEKDVDTLTQRKYTAFTYGGVNDWQSDFSELVKGADVVILADNDKPGIEVANAILQDIKEVAKSAMKSYMTSAKSLLYQYAGTSGKMAHLLDVETPDYISVAMDSYIRNNAADKFLGVMDKANAILPESKVKRVLTENDKKLIDTMIDPRYPSLAKDKVKALAEADSSIESLLLLDERYNKYLEE